MFGIRFERRGKELGGLRSAGFGWDWRDQDVEGFGLKRDRNLVWYCEDIGWGKLLIYMVKINEFHIIFNIKMNIMEEYIVWMSEVEMKISFN